MPGAPRGRSSGGGGRRRHLLTRVLDAVREAGDARGCSAKQILNFLNSGSAAKEAVDKARLVMALKRGVQAGTLAYSGGRYKPGAKSTGWREICCRKRPAKWRARCRRMFSRPCRKIRRCRKKRRRSCRRRRRSCRRRRRSCRRRRRSCRRRRRSCRRKRRSCRRRRRPSCCPRRRRRRSCRRRRRRCSYDDPDLEAASMSAAKGGGGGTGSGNGGARSQQK